MKTIGLLLLIIVFVRALCYNRSEARKACARFSADAESNPEVRRLLEQVARERSLESGKKFITPDVEAYLITKTTTGIHVYSLHSRKPQTMLSSQYRKLMKRFEATNVVCKYSLNSYSLYYKYGVPFEDTILRIDYQ